MTDGRHEHDERNLMTRAEVARYLRVSLSSVDRLRRSGCLGPDRYVGVRSRRFVRSWVVAYADTNTPPTGTPLE